MKRCLIAVTLAAVVAPASAAIVYEPFDYEAAPNGPNGPQVAAGSTEPFVQPDRTGFFVIAGKSPDGGAHTWSTYAAPTSTRRDQGGVNEGSFAVPPGLPPAVGNHYVYGGVGETARIDLGSTFTSGVLYYSMMVRMETLGTVASGFTQIAGFNNSTGTASVTQVIGQLTGKAGSAVGTYKLGIAKNANSAGYVFDEDNEYALGGGPNFVVVRFDFAEPGGQDAIASLWVNPNPADFGKDEADVPAPTVFSTLAVNDISQLQSFIFYQYQAASTSGGLSSVDELRVDTTWAGVTPIPEPAAIGLLVLGASMLMRRRREVR